MVTTFTVIISIMQQMLTYQHMKLRLMSMFLQIRMKLVWSVWHEADPENIDILHVLYSSCCLFSAPGSEEQTSLSRAEVEQRQWIWLKLWDPDVWMRQAKAQIHSVCLSCLICDIFAVLFGTCKKSDQYTGIGLCISILKYDPGVFLPLYTLS